MKKPLSVFLTLLIALSLFMGILPASALSYTEYENMTNTTYRADYFYDGMSKAYIINVVSNELWNKYGKDDEYTATVPATEFENVLNKFFVIDSSMLAAIKTELSYNASAETYTINYPGGFGGMMPERSLLGYVHNSGNRYTFYYQHVTYEFLLDDVVSQYTDNGSGITHNGVHYEGGPDGYYRIASYDDYGKMHTVELNGDVVRFVSSADYVKADLPASFDKVPSKTVATPTNAPATPKPTASPAPAKTPEATSEPTAEPSPELTAPPVLKLETVAEAEGVVVEIQSGFFPENTVVKIEKIQDQAKNDEIKNTLGSNANKFVAYEITATSDNFAVQPGGSIHITFEFPEDYDIEKTLILYVPVEGKTEIVNSKLNENGTITAITDHLSTYVLVESVEPVPSPDFAGNNSSYWENNDQPVDKNNNGWIIAVVVIVVVLAAGGAVAWYFLYFKKKKNVK